MLDSSEMGSRNGLGQHTGVQTGPQQVVLSGQRHVTSEMSCSPAKKVSSPEAA
jgi:hypothetical protein